MSAHFYRTNGDSIYHREKARAYERARMQVEGELLRSKLSIPRELPLDIIGFVISHSDVVFVPEKPIRKDCTTLIGAGCRVTKNGIATLTKRLDKDTTAYGYFRKDKQPEESHQGSGIFSRLGRLFG